VICGVIMLGLEWLVLVLSLNAEVGLDSQMNDTPPRQEPVPLFLPSNYDNLGLVAQPVDRFFFWWKFAIEEFVKDCWVFEIFDTCILLIQSVNDLFPESLDIVSLVSRLTELSFRF